MANDLQEVLDILVTRGVSVLRENAKMPMLVNRDYETDVADRHEKVRVPVSSPVAVNKVTNAASPPAPTDLNPTGVEVELTEWDLASFTMNDDEVGKVKADYFPMQAEEAVKAIANSVDLHVLNLWKQGCFTLIDSSDPFVFSDLAGLDAAMFNNLVPQTGRNLMVRGTLRGEMLARPEFVHVDTSGETAGLREASLGRKLAFDIFGDQNIAAHTSGTLATKTVDGAHTAGPDHVDGDDGGQVVTFTGGTGTAVVGDIINIAGSGQHCITKIASNDHTIRPALRADMSGGEAVSYVTGNGAGAVVNPNIAFHRDSMAFASRPLQGQLAPGSLIASQTDPVSGLTLRLEVKRVGKTNVWEYDCLYGASLIRPELIAVFTD